MQFTSLLFAAAAFVGAASAQGVLNITNIDVSGLKVGVPFTVTWGSAKGPVKLTLQHGLDALDLKTYEVLTTAGTFPDGSFVFTPPATLPSDNYNFLVEDGVSKPNYSKQFQFFGVSNPTGTLTSAGTTSSTTSGGPTSKPSTSDSSASSTGTTSSSTSKSTSKTSAAPSSTGSGTPPAVNSKNGSGRELASPIAVVFFGLAAFFAIN